MQYTISTDKSRLNIEAIHDYLCHKSYWAKGRSFDRVKRSIDNSTCFGIYDEHNNMLGFGRVITDKVVFAYLMDFFVFDQYQGKGIGQQLATYIVEYADYQEVRLWFLATNTAHGFYEKLGFKRIEDTSKHMYIRNENNL